MKKLLQMAVCLLFLNSCKEERPKETTAMRRENIILSDSIKNLPPEKSELTNEDLKKQRQEVNHLFVANSGSILYMKNGDIKGQARFETDGDFVTELLKTETYGRYKDYDNYVLGTQGDTSNFFETNGRVGIDWRILKGIDIKDRLQVASFTSPKKEEIAETEVVKTTRLLIFSPEKKVFEDENSPEAENYFTAMDDWNFYSSKLTDYFETLKVDADFTQKRYLLFEIENNRKITIDTKSKINNYYAQCLLHN